VLGRRNDDSSSSTIIVARRRRDRRRAFLLESGDGLAWIDHRGRLPDDVFSEQGVVDASGLWAGRTLGAMERPSR